MAHLGLSWKIINASSFAVNTLATYVVGASKHSAVNILGATFVSNQSISAKYPTLVTPSGYAFSIWGPIFLLEGAATIYDVFVANNAEKTPSGTTVTALLGESSVYWSAACLLQASWAFIFGANRIVESTVAMMGIAYCMRQVYATSAAIQSGGESGLTVRNVTLRLTQLAFSLHSAWVNCAAIINVNMAANALGLSYEAQMYIAWASMFAAVGIALYTTYKYQDPVPAIVTAWALIAMGNNDTTPYSAVYVALSVAKAPVDTLQAQYTVAGYAVGFFGVVQAAIPLLTN
ncbi:hypothetical protein SARC_12829 [Sphaeroforma arctica JP610]|uniref:Uncharacterized protein n=1 Tax=Sphaeroforma arctica JP610 TaxID=667725 RepID=A0A0L0FD18_9EUKA|nr:hypothetical protein SARC_12829 [Sphaeroforma arctica JP610]KNC74630.1 hypothetical protein SARC_12829 [Sphaeroforma arctica JP610]|eukprot:XP_014148532.1 hypothetical protein SARC_12829 [Sphaeroforma arctica JP610]